MSEIMVGEDEQGVWIGLNDSKTQGIYRGKMWVSKQFLDKLLKEYEYCVIDANFFADKKLVKLTWNGIKPGSPWDNMGRIAGFESDTIFRKPFPNPFSS